MKGGIMEQESQVVVIPNNPAVPHPDLVLTEQGWTMKKIVHPLPPALDKVVRVFKLFSPTQTCPIHGETEVKDVSFDKKYFSGVEGLACGHTILISRVKRGLKEKVSGYLSDPKNWRFGGWQLTFKETK
jgi:hypothetical protein